MKSKWIEKQEKRILFIDLSDFRNNILGFEEELTLTVSTIGQEMYVQPLHSVLVLVDLTNTSITPEANHLLSERISDTKKICKAYGCGGHDRVTRHLFGLFCTLSGFRDGGV